VKDAVLEIDRISVRYDSVPALQDVSLVVRPGELLGLAGGTGAGKTTTIRVGAGVQSADTGRVRWCSAPIDPGTRRRIGYLPTLGGLYPRLSVGDQLVHRGELHGLTTNEAHRRTQGWLDRLNRRALRTRRADRLDRDDRQLVALIAVLLPIPELLLLDEPFAGVSAAGTHTMVEVLREQADSGVPVLFSSKDFDLVQQHCDRAAVIRSGQIKGEGTVAELLSAGPVVIAIDAPDATPGWAASVPGCRILDVDGSRIVVEMAPGADDQVLLNAALVSGPVREFTRLRRSLASLFDDDGPTMTAVSAGTAGTAGTTASDTWTTDTWTSDTEIDDTETDAGSAEAESDADAGAGAGDTESDETPAVGYGWTP
jgi:ABC-2 type transport system ATP-binding protein